MEEWYMVFGYDLNEKKPNPHIFGPLFPMVADGFYRDIEDAKSSKQYFQELHPDLKFRILEVVKENAKV
tara:strand:- start:132 stop:338 length:207 start_codon:yes stop_codon:yes gene_type:complete